MSESKLYEDMVRTTRELLVKNQEWREQFKGYATTILEQIDSIESDRKRIKETQVLKYYITTSNAKRTGNRTLEVRYQGQTVAKLIFKEKEILLDTCEQEETNERDFGCTIRLHKASWSSEAATAFRSYFENKAPDKSSHHESRIESLLLTEFSKPTGKQLLNIQPVRIAGVRFSMPTPISASNPDCIEHITGSKCGAIDILARTGSPNTELCIIELKDENTPKEPPIAALKQAIAYATFIRELLRSNSGKDWWKLFGFTRELPEKLTIRAACAMPLIKSEDRPRKGEGIQIEQDFIELHYISFTEEDNVITAIESSLPGNPK